MGIEWFLLAMIAVGGLLSGGLAWVLRRRGYGAPTWRTPACAKCGYLVEPPPQDLRCPECAADLHAKPPAGGVRPADGPIIARRQQAFLVVVVGLALVSIAVRVAAGRLDRVVLERQVDVRMAVSEDAPDLDDLATIDWVLETRASARSGVRRDPAATGGDRWAHAPIREDAVQVRRDGRDAAWVGAPAEDVERVGRAVVAVVTGGVEPSAVAPAVETAVLGRSGEVRGRSGVRMQDAPTMWIRDDWDLRRTTTVDRAVAQWSVPARDDGQPPVWLLVESEDRFIVHHLVPAPVVLIGISVLMSIAPLAVLGHGLLRAAPVAYDARPGGGSEPTDERGHRTAGAAP